VEAEIKDSFPDIEVELEEGRHGVFKVFLDGRKIFGRIPFFGNFPRESEITKKIQARMGN
jgi:selT/selW/selH-like putative selenoprotein